MNTVATIIGYATIVWWMAGLVLFTFCKVHVTSGAPWSARITAAAVSGFVLPFIVWRNGGKLPASIIAPVEEEMSAEEQRAIQQFMDRVRGEKCNCPSCRQRRGE